MDCPNRNHFCFVCALFTPSRNAHSLTAPVIQGYEKYFVKQYSSAWYQPDIVCDYCYNSLKDLGMGRTKYSMKYVAPALWNSVLAHSNSECYCCQSFAAHALNYNYHTRELINYPKVSALTPARKRSPEQPKSQYEVLLEEQQQQQQQQTIELDMGDDYDISEQAGTSTGDQTSEFVPTQSEMTSNALHLITQKDFDDVIRETQESKRNAEIWGSRLKEWNLVAGDFKVTSARKRAKTTEVDRLFSFNRLKTIAYCNDIDAIFEYFNIEHSPDEWRLFIDSSSSSLKGVLLHIGNQHPSIPVIYGTGVSESYEVMDEVLTLIDYWTYNWKICCDLKVVGILTGLKRGYPTYNCFLCLYEGRKKEYHYTNHKWAPRVNYLLGAQSIDNPPLVNPENVIAH